MKLLQLLLQKMARESKKVGLYGPGVTSVLAPNEEVRERYLRWVEMGFHGEMEYMGKKDRIERRFDPSLLMLPYNKQVDKDGNDGDSNDSSKLKSVLMFFLPYLPGSNQFPLLHQYQKKLGNDNVDDDDDDDKKEEELRGVISSYAWGRDYHDIFSEKLKDIAEMMKTEAVKMGIEENKEAIVTKCLVDSGPVMERHLAVRAGLGFIGKNTLLIHPHFGSGFFIGEIFTSLDFTNININNAIEDENESKYDVNDGIINIKKMPSCGKCQRCITACPTNAFVGPYQLDARKCISYLTIELKTSIPIELRPLMGNKIYGCDICQQVCPFNKIFKDPSPLWGSPPEHVTTPNLIELMALDDEGFKQRFKDSPIFRIKRKRLLRNGNKQTKKT